MTVRVSISYPPIETTKGTPLLSQNRQFQYFNEPTYIYPCVPAYGATMLKRAGHEVSWDDGIAERLTLRQYSSRMEQLHPDLVCIETKAPTIKTYWRTIDAMKDILPDTKVALMGDHVTAFPEESLRNSRVDFAIMGGDYDFLMVNLANHLERGDPLEPGFWFREDGGFRTTGPFEQNHDVERLPPINRDLTKWWLYTKNGNFKYEPGTYTYVGRDCWWRKDGGCTFCSWTVLYKKFQVRRPESLVNEIENLVTKYGIREVFDDTGTFPVGPWLQRFCNMIIERGLNEKVKIGCNMRFDALSREEYKLMGKAGFRFILYGLESANSHTLDGLNKGTSREEAINACHWAKEAGLDPHLTIMMGYPWETYEDAKQTADLARYIFKRGWADTLQATIVIPYPGTALWKQAKENGWLLTEDYDRYDMREAILKSPLTNDEIKGLTQGLYRVFLTPRHVMRRIAMIRTRDDLDFAWRGVKYVFGHLKDFKKGSEMREPVAENVERTGQPT